MDERGVWAGGRKSSQRPLLEQRGSVDRWVAFWDGCGHGGGRPFGYDLCSLF